MPHNGGQTAAQARAHQAFPLVAVVGTVLLALLNVTVVRHSDRRGLPALLDQRWVFYTTDPIRPVFLAAIRTEGSWRRLRLERDELGHLLSFERRSEATAAVLDSLGRTLSKASWVECHAGLDCLDLALPVEVVLAVPDTRLCGLFGLIEARPVLADQATEANDGFVGMRGLRIINTCRT